MLEALDVFLYFSPQNLNDVYRLDLIYNINMLLQHKHVSTGNLDSQNCYYGLMNQQHRVFTGSMHSCWHAHKISSKSWHSRN